MTMRAFLFAAIALTGFSGFSQQHFELYFDTDKARVSPSLQLTIDAWLKDHPATVITAIKGYCDETAPSDYNAKLSRRRADSVYAFLKTRNASFSQNVAVEGFGETAPDGIPMWKNRRVEIHYSLLESEPTPPVETVLQRKITQAAVGDKIKLENINFYNMSARVVPQSEPRLKELLSVMRDNPNLKIEIQGHICCQTSQQRDYSGVSTLRAKAIYEYLIQNGIDRERLSYKGFGVSRPIHPIPEKNDREANENRRVEIEVISN